MATNYIDSNWENTDWEEVDVDYKIQTPDHDAGIVLHAHGADEMIRITRDGFYVRGVRVPVDDQEAETVYLAFKQWLAWAQLQR